MIGAAVTLCFLIILLCSCIGFAFRHKDGQIAVAMIFGLLLAFAGLASLIGELQYRQGINDSKPKIIKKP